MKFIALSLLLIFPLAASAEDLCQSPGILRAKVAYCHENIAYYDAGKACQKDYLDVVTREQARIKKALDEQVRTISNTAQKQDLQESGKALKSTIEDLDYLIDYGKQVHTELEDYVYELVLPVFDGDAVSDVSNPAVQAEFRTRECYGPPATELEKIQAELRPVIEDLEKTKEYAIGLARQTGSYETNLGTMPQQALKTNSAPGAGAPAKAPERKGRKGSDISGTEDKKKK